MKHNLKMGTGYLRHNKFPTIFLLILWQVHRRITLQYQYILRHISHFISRLKLFLMHCDFPWEILLTKFLFYASQRGPRRMSWRISWTDNILNRTGPKGNLSNMRSMWQVKLGRTDWSIYVASCHLLGATATQHDNNHRTLRCKYLRLLLW